MTLHINGEEREFPDGLTVASLVAQLGMKPDRVAVELNLAIVPRSAWDHTSLKSGDKLELVHFVGGGTGSGVSQDVEAQAGTESSQAGTAPEPWKCATCSATGNGLYCPACGEKRPSSHDFSL